MNYLEIIPNSIEFKKISDHEYFNSPLYKDYVSNSKLSLIDPERGGSIEKFNEGFESGYNESFELGTAVHGYLLQPDEYEIADFTKPTGKVGLFAEAYYKYTKQGLEEEEVIKLAIKESDYYKGKPSASRLKLAVEASKEYFDKRDTLVEKEGIETLILSEKLLNDYTNIINSLKSSKTFNRYLEPEGIAKDPTVYSEWAIFCDIVNKTTGEITKFKAKFDNITVDLENNVVTLNDIKTTFNINNFFKGYEFYKDTGEHVVVQSSFEKYNYYRQCGVYLWLLHHIMREKYPNIKFTYNVNILAVQTSQDYKSEVFKVSKKWIDKGLNEFKKLILLINGR